MQFGSPLAPGSVVNWGCEAEPAIDVSGNYGLVANTKGHDCTWRQAGVWGSETDSRVSSVPGDGRIVRAEILSGPNPAPLRIAVLRQLGTGGFAGQCCFFVSETAPIALVPNAVTTIPLDIAVERNTLKGILAADLMGISAVAGTGTLPLRAAGSNNIFSEPIGTRGRVPSTRGSARSRTTPAAAAARKAFRGSKSSSAGPGARAATPAANPGPRRRRRRR